MCIFIKVKLGCMKCIWASVRAKCVPEDVQWSWLLRYLSNHFNWIYNAKWYVNYQGEKSNFEGIVHYNVLGPSTSSKDWKKLRKIWVNCPRFWLASRMWIRNSNHVKEVFNSFIWVLKDNTSHIITDSALHIYLIMSHYKTWVLARSIGFILIFQKEPVYVSSSSTSTTFKNYFPFKIKQILSQSQKTPCRCRLRK
jgi:hypothetical protein